MAYVTQNPPPPLIHLFGQNLKHSIYFQTINPLKDMRSLLLKFRPYLV